MTNRWIMLPRPSEESISVLMEQVNLPRPLAILLAQRGVDDFEKARAFLRPSLDNLYDPFLMKDMDKAVDRIIQALEMEESILVYGDYDVDGTTSVAMMYHFLKSLNAKVSFYIPDRYTEGYGISTQGIDHAAENDISLIIALDCGVKAIDQTKYAAELGIDFVICDHHMPGEQLPPAVAILDPKREDCDYPYDGLSGCGVGFKLIQALCTELGIDQERAMEYLDLVCVSTAADIVPINDENRILAYYGLEIINSNPRLGIQLMIPEENKGYINISRIVFSIAPKINAAGRIQHAHDAVNLLLVENKLTGRQFLSDINQLNTQRKNIDSEITKSALTQLQQAQDDSSYSTVVYDPSWHKGVIGIVASRLTEFYYRPTVVFTKGENGTLVASVRSVKDFDVYEALCECEELLDKFGGHMYAAGLSMPERNLPNFRRKFENSVRNRITESQRIPSIEIDTEIDFDVITPRFLKLLKLLEPFGPCNLTPHFLTKNLQNYGGERTMGKQHEHIRLNLFCPKTRKTFTAVGFGFGQYLRDFQKYTFDLVYVIEENIWQGKSHTQLQIRDVRFHK
ncbi:MAG: single-stranded-DNA-specific exonuclease RecJ [Weeksellaceae bacterium]|nr:single-stranded-DNA-specific exonuclease RecJ [Weeksellaceae bacterium]